MLTLGENKFVVLACYFLCRALLHNVSDNNDTVTVVTRGWSIEQWSFLSAATTCMRESRGSTISMLTENLRK